MASPLASRPGPSTEALDDEILCMEISRVDAVQRDRIIGRQVDHGIAGAVVADQALQLGPTCKTVIVNVDSIMAERLWIASLRSQWRR